MKKIIFIFIIAIMCGCGDVYTSYDLTIVNKTTDTIKFYFTGTTAYTQGKDSVIVYPLSENNYFHLEGHPTKNACDYNGIYPNDVRVVVSNGKSLVKEISNIDNWECEGNRKIGWKMTFVINDSDLE